MARQHPPDASSAQFGANVRARRLELGWTQERLADAVGLHFTYISSVERGERNVSLRTIVRLAAALRTSPADLVRDF